MKWQMWIKRLLVYCVGLFLTSLGVSVSILSNLGVSPVSSLPYVVSCITKINLGVCVTAIYCFFIFLQFVLLGRQFKLINLLQIGCSTLLGWFVNITNALVQQLIGAPQNYFSSLIMLVCSILLLALGVSLYVQANVVVAPAEGLMKAFACKASLKTGTAKMYFDMFLVAIAVALAFIFLHRLEGVREGTIVASFGVGSTMKLCEKFLSKPVDRFIYGKRNATQNETEQVVETKQN